MDWDRVRIFLAIARTGQILAAARQLGLNHSTVGRHLALLESDLRAKLFDRQANGCVLTAAGEALLAAAEKIESEVVKAETTITGAATAIRGTVRIGAPEGLGNYFLAGVLARFAEQHPQLVIQLIPLPRTFSLSRREADLAVTVERPEQGRLIVQKLTNYTLSLYASRDYLERTGPIATDADLADRVLVTDVDDIVYTPALNYGSTLDGLTSHRFECGNLTGQLEAVRAGAGFGILHDIAARRYSELCRILPQRRFTRSYWLLSHPDTHDVTRIAAVRQHVAKTIRNAAAEFSPP
jgi:molybdate transport repressor ModE-like protein